MKNDVEKIILVILLIITFALLIFVVKMSDHEANILKRQLFEAIGQTEYIQLRGDKYFLNFISAICN